MVQQLDNAGQITVSGFAGMGKSELVKQFIWKMCEAENPKYKCIIWLDAGSDSLPAETQARAQELGVGPADRTMKELWREIAMHMGKEEFWLVIFDNLEDISKFKDLALEELRRIHVIVTTRYWRAASHGELELLNRLDTNQGIQLFRTEYDARSRPGQSLEFGDQELSTLVSTIGSHPAAITQVVSYLQVTGADVQKFLRAYKKSREQFWDWGTTEFPSLFTQISTVFRGVKENLNHLRLLCLFSFVHSDGIPHWFLRSNPWLRDDALKRILGSDWELDKALGPLLTWSVIARTRTGFSIQKIAQECMRVIMSRTESNILDQLDEHERSVKYWTSRASELIYPLQGHFTWSRFAERDEIAKQAECCLQWCAQYGVDCAMNQALIQAFTAYALLITGQKYDPKLWSTVVERYQKIQELEMGIKEGLVCHFMSLRWCILKNYDAACTASQRSLQTSNQLVEQNGRWSLQYTYQLGFILREQGHHGAAATHFQKVIDSFGENAYQRVVPLLELARCQSDERIEIVEKADGIAKNALGSEAAETALPIMLMGTTLVEQGQKSTGLPLCAQAIDRFETEFGEEDPRAIVLVEHIARIFQGLGEHGSALEWLKKVGPACDRLYQMNSIFCATTLERMAVSLCRQGEYQEAWRCFEKLHKLTEVFVNPTATPKATKLEIGEAVGMLSDSLLSRSRYSEAKSLRQCVISQLEQRPMGPGQGTAKARHQVVLATIYEDNGDLKQAQQELKDAVEILRLALGDEIQEVVNAQKSLDRIARILERHREGEKSMGNRLHSDPATDPRAEVGNFQEQPAGTDHGRTVKIGLKAGKSAEDSETPRSEEIGKSLLEKTYQLPERRPEVSLESPKFDTEDFERKPSRSSAVDRHSRAPGTSEREVELPERLLQGYDTLVILFVLVLAVYIYWFLF